MLKAPRFRRIHSGTRHVVNHVYSKSMLGAVVSSPDSKIITDNWTMRDALFQKGLKLRKRVIGAEYVERTAQGPQA